MIESRRRRESWEPTRAVDDQLAQWKPGELLYLEAADLRVGWRLALGSSSEFDEAMEILTPLIERVSLPRFLLYRAQIAMRQGRTTLAWVSLNALAASLVGRSAPGVAAQGVALARELGEPPDPQILKQLQRIAHGRRPFGAQGMAPPRS